MLEHPPNPTCPACGRVGFCVMQYGVPAKICSDETCSTLWGALSRVWTWLPFTGALVVYPPGGYWGALWRFVRGDYASQG